MGPLIVYSWLVDFNCPEDEVLSWNHASVLAAGSEADGFLPRSAGQVEKDTHTSCSHGSMVRENRMSLARLDRLYCFQHQFRVFRTFDIVPVGFTGQSLFLFETVEF